MGSAAGWVADPEDSAAAEVDFHLISRAEQRKLRVAPDTCRTKDDGRCIEPGKRKSAGGCTYAYFSSTSMDWNRLFGRLFVAFVLFLIIFIGYSSQIFIIWPWYGREFSVEFLGLLVPFK
jgi:hypothetical protein